jgi:hypothetical protein
MAKKYIQVCPKCGGVNIKSVYLLSPKELALPAAKKLKAKISAGKLGALGVGWQPENQSVCLCLDCGYNGICPEIEVDQLDKFRKEFKKN